MRHTFINRPPRASPLGGTHLHQSAASRVATRWDTPSSVGRPARRHSARHTFISRLPHASPLGETHHLNSPPPRRHSVERSIDTRPHRAPSLCWTRHHHSAVPCIATRRDTPSSLDNPACHHFAKRTISTRPPHAPLLCWTHRHHSTAPPSPLGRTHLRHLAAPCFDSQPDVSTSLDRPARRHTAKSFFTNYIKLNSYFCITECK